MRNEFDDIVLSIEEQILQNERDQPEEIYINENERLDMLEEAVQDLIIATMSEGGEI